MGWGVLWGDFTDLVLDFGEVDKSIGEVDQVLTGARSEVNDFDFDTFVEKSVDKPCWRSLVRSCPV